MKASKRVSKSPEARRAEIVATAARLFNDRGYDGTAVSDIVREMGVAQGTFYYHFESKEAVLDAVAVSIADEVVASVRAVVRRRGMDAVEKLAAVSTVTRDAVAGRESLMAYVHEEKNAALHDRIEHRVSPALRDAIESIVRQGVEEGVFDAPHPRETALAVLGFSAEVEGDHHDHTRVDELPRQALRRRVEVFARILGADADLLLPMLTKARGSRR